ncbi:MAG: hypothetical protein A2008_12895 [Candidatus Wallbacteria bacterium GWC2_49_35]|uniref:DUF5667 domain-containing protein n=1 Tax=Candidatus Wallbacteria bacterium GWC2_49_35 TaxID=1817813 RepID=A0A1F7WFY6_9BACT|nr:MAG: hypothetical protein A2008_12895 [Candidatus Wallbacteria bacterium GWC2_49_35]HBC75748.1 hypothetical protein [Candidatus Wallbacteria bacterium]
MFRKSLAIFLIITLVFFMFMEGCGKKDGEEAPPAEGEEGAEPADGEVQEASRTAAPVAPPPAAAPPRPVVPPKPVKGAPAEKQVTIKSRQVPDDRFLPIEFDTKEAALVTTGQTYSGKIRRNVFRDIKSDSKLRKDAENSIIQARKMYDKVKVMPAGTYNEPLLKQADEMLKQGEAAFKDQNYFKAKMMADKSYELAFDAIPRANTNNEKPTVELLYKGFYQLSEDKTAMLTKKDPETGVEKLFMVQEGSVVAEDLPNAVVVEMPDGTQKKITKIEYKVEQISEDKIVITNITENKPSFSIDISRPSETKTSAAPAAKGAAKTPAASGGSPFQSNQTTKTGGSSTSGNTMKGF